MQCSVLSNSWQFTTSPISVVPTDLIEMSVLLPTLSLLQVHSIVMKSRSRLCCRDDGIYDARRTGVSRMTFFGVSGASGLNSGLYALHYIVALPLLSLPSHPTLPTAPPPTIC